MNDSIKATPAPLLYQVVADRITGLIDGNTFGPGDRLPSVRQLSQQMDVSLSTVMEAYRRLEDGGRIEARPQSGYYVVEPARAHNSKLNLEHNVNPAILPDEPALSRPSPGPTPITTRELTLRVMRHHNDPTLIPLGAAIPNPALLPVDKLNRTLARVIRQVGAQGHIYDPPPGCEALRIQVARRLVVAGCSLTPDQIVTTVGSQEAISLCLRAICKPGDTVAIESPIYYGILQAIDLQGLRALEIPTHPQTGISLDALEYALEQNDVKACVAIPNYSNPIGSLMPDENKRRLVEMLAGRSIPLIEDDIYGDLGHGSVRPKPAKAWDNTGNVLLCSSFSKTLSPGYRVGYVAAGRWQDQVEWHKIVTNLATPLPTQLAVADFLAEGGYDHHLRHVRRAYARQTSLMGRAVGHYMPPGTKVTRPVGGFVLWVELPVAIDALWLFERALSMGISLAPGPMFSARRRYGNYVRLNTAFWSPRVEEALEKLGSLLRDQAH